MSSLGDQHWPRTVLYAAHCIPCTGRSASAIPPTGWASATGPQTRATLKSPHPRRGVWSSLCFPGAHLPSTTTAAGSNWKETRLPSLLPSDVLSWAWDYHPTVRLSCLQRLPAHCPLSRWLESLFPNPGCTDSTPAMLRSPSLSASTPSEAQSLEVYPVVLLMSRSHGIPAH